MVDLRNIYNPTEMAQVGFRYHCLGRPFAEPAAVAAAVAEPV